MKVTVITVMSLTCAFEVNVNEAGAQTTYDGDPSGPVDVSIKSIMRRDDGQHVTDDQENMLTDIVMHEACTQVAKRIEEKLNGVREPTPHAGAVVASA